VFPVRYRIELCGRGCAPQIPTQKKNRIFFKEIYKRKNIFAGYFKATYSFSIASIRLGVVRPPNGNYESSPPDTIFTASPYQLQSAGIGK
jgi:hypothetical protein